MDGLMGLHGISIFWAQATLRLSRSQGSKVPVWVISRISDDNVGTR